MHKNSGFATRAIHIGQSPDPLTGAVSLPVYQTSTFKQRDFADFEFDYSRADNPTRHNLEETIASLEGGAGAVAFGSGLAAESAVFSLLSAGDHILFSKNVYGGTFRIFESVFSRFGLQASWVDSTKPAEVEKALRTNTKMIFVETPTNPMMQLTDIAAVAELAKNRKLLLVVDNTFMSPYYQRPLSLGARLVIHSTTKYLNGHSDVIGGVVISSDEDLVDQLRFLQMSVGAVPGPFDCWLTQRSLKTLALRMQAHNRNAMTLAENLAGSAKIETVFYPGLSSHPQHDLAKQQQQDPFGNPGFGGMISITLKDITAARNFTQALSVFTLAESLGGVESLICHPATMTHASIPPEERAALGISEGLLRLSVGIEDIGDLLQDVDRGLAAI
ncbi:MAG: PLP-dependent transferase [FCB group bacterium]|nr:PLP-dependent transferase [FCB group bacterium]